MQVKHTTACSHCGLIINLPNEDMGYEFRCKRCHSLIYRSGKAFELILPILIATIIFFLLSLSVPLLEIKIGDFESKIGLVQTILLFFKDGYILVGVVALLGGIVIPLLMMGLLLIVILSVRQKNYSLTRFCFRFYQQLHVWGMAEVYLISLLVTIIKLKNMAKLSYEDGFILFAIYLIGFFIVSIWFNPQDIWGEPYVHQTDNENDSVLCIHCNLLNPKQQEICLRCGARIYERKPHSLAKTWVFSLSAFFFIVPANLLPMMLTTKFGVSSGSTIMDGIIYFFEEGAYGIGIVILTASILIPLFKLLTLFYLLTIVQFKITGHAKINTKLFHIIHFIGKWSMIDVFVVGLMVAAIQFGAILKVDTGPAAPAFTLAVVLTMIATLSFDIRLLWDMENNEFDLKKDEEHEHGHESDY